MTARWAPRIEARVRRRRAIWIAEWVYFGNEPPDVLLLTNTPDPEHLWPFIDAYSLRPREITTPRMEFPEVCDNVGASSVTIP